MQFDLHAICRHARAQIAVPAFPLDDIRREATQFPRTPVSHRKGAALAPIVLVSMLAAAAASEAWSGTRIVDAPGRGVAISADTGAMVLKRPTGRDVKAAVQKVSFPVTLPAGLPSGAVLRTLVRFGSGAIMMQYDLPGSWRRSNHLFMMILADPNVINRNDEHHYKISLQFGGEAAKGSLMWRIGKEDVIIPHSTITALELARIKNAMTKNRVQ